MGDNCDSPTVLGLTNGSLSPAAVYSVPVPEYRIDGPPPVPTVNGLRSRDDFAEASSGEKAVRRVSGVPFKESALPLEERGEEEW